MKLVKIQVGNENRVALIDEDGRLQELYIQRTNMLNLGERINGIIRQKNKALRGYFIETDKKLSVFVPSKDALAVGAHVTVEITKEARRDKDANGIFTSLSPAFAQDKAALLSEQLGLPILDEWDAYDLDNQILDLLNPSVAFDGTATLKIEHTAVCHTIDVDSGNETKSWDKLNLIAAKECVRQIRLRSMAGAILIDFAGRKLNSEVRDLIQFLKKEMAQDTRTTVMGATGLGLIEIRRTRTSAALSDIMTTPTGHLNAPATAYQILRTIKKMHAICPTVRAHPTVIALIQEHLAHVAKMQADITIAPDFYEIKEKK